MKRQRLWVAATVIGLSAPLLASMSSPARAQNYQSAPYSNRYDRNYGNYPSYPRLQSMRRVGILAENVERAAIRLEQDTFIRRNSLSWQERRAMRQIQALTGSASHFRAQVQSYQRDPSHTQADFEIVRSRMDELMRNYGGPSRWSRYDTHGSYTR